MEERKKIAESIIYPFIFVSILWIIKFFESFFSISFAQLGILPRTIKGLPGILFSPLIHGDINHLGSNTLPLLILGIIILYFYRQAAFELFLIIYGLSGLFVWITADGAGYHLGASGLIYGFVSFLFFSGMFRKDRRSLALSLLVTFVYGGMVWGIFPISNGISWESHLTGALIGTICAWFYRKTDPYIEEKYDWQEPDTELKPQNDLIKANPFNHFTFTHNQDDIDAIYPKKHTLLDKKTPVKYRYIYFEKDKYQNRGAANE